MAGLLTVSHLLPRHAKESHHESRRRIVPAGGAGHRPDSGGLSLASVSNSVVVVLDVSEIRSCSDFSSLDSLMFDSRLEVDTRSNRIAYPALMSDAVESGGCVRIRVRAKDGLNPTTSKSQEE